jgi:hypothetical protein
MASVDRIEVRFSADKRLARVVRAAVSVAARGAGVPAGRATRLAACAARRFRGLAARGAGRTNGKAAIELTLEPAAGGLDVRIWTGARRGGVLRVPEASRRSPRRPTPRQR